MRSRTCKKCFTNIGYYPEWVNGSPYCHPHADAKKEEIRERQRLASGEEEGSGRAVPPAN